MIPVAARARIWIATGHTDMRKGMRAWHLFVQEGLGRYPFAGNILVFRGRAGSLIKALWHDGVGLSLTTTSPNHSVRLSRIAICSISSFTFDALAEWPHVAKVAITFLVTAIATVTLALPLAAFDGWWL